MSSSSAWIVGILCGATLAACGLVAVSTTAPSPHPTATQTAPLTPGQRLAQFGAAYVFDTNAVNIAAATLYKELDAFAGQHPTQTAVESDTSPYASALVTLDDTLRDYTVPAPLEADVRVLVNADAKELADIADIPAATNFRAWEMEFVGDDTAAASAAATVGADLSLPAQS